MGELCDLLTGFPFESKDFSSEGIPLIRGMNVKRGYLDLTDELCEHWADSNGYENYLLESNDIVIQMDGALIGRSHAIIRPEYLPSLLVQRVTRVRCYSVDSNYIYQSIQKDFPSYVKGLKTETAVPHLSLSDISEYPITLPVSNQEIEAIGAFLSDFDNLITLHQRKC